MENLTEIRQCLRRRRRKFSVGSPLVIEGVRALSHTCFQKVCIFYGALGLGVYSCICAHSAPQGNPYFVILGALLLFETRYFDASFALGIWYIWIFTHFHPFSPIFTHFLLISTTSTPFQVDFSPPWGPREGRGCSHIECVCLVLSEALHHHCLW